MLVAVDYPKAPRGEKISGYTPVPGAEVLSVTTSGLERPDGSEAQQSVRVLVAVDTTNEVDAFDRARRVADQIAPQFGHPQVEPSSVRVVPREAA